MQFFSPQDCLAIWIANKPTRHGKTLWASICKCIECAVEQDEIARTLSDIKTDIAKHDTEIRADERRKFAEWLINSKYHGICNEGFMYGVSDLNFKFSISRIDEILAEYEKEQTND